MAIPSTVQDTIHMLIGMWKLPTKNDRKWNEYVCTNSLLECNDVQYHSYMDEYDDDSKIIIVIIIIIIRITNFYVIIFSQCLHRQAVIPNGLLETNGVICKFVFKLKIAVCCSRQPMPVFAIIMTSNEHHNISNDWPLNCINACLGNRQRKYQRYKLATLYWVNTPVTNGFPLNMASHARNVCISRRQYLI